MSAIFAFLIGTDMFKKVVNIFNFCFDFADNGKCQQKQKHSNRSENDEGKLQLLVSLVEEKIVNVMIANICQCLIEIFLNMTVMVFYHLVEDNLNELFDLNGCVVINHYQIQVT